MTGFERVEGDEEAALELLADQIAEELGLAGLPVVRGGGAGSGAEIEVDVGADDAGGVYVTWQPDPRLSQAAAHAVQEGRFDEPMIRRSGAVKQVMITAVAEILRSAHFHVATSTDDMRPLAIQVSAPHPGSGG